MHAAKGDAAEIEPNPSCFRTSAFFTGPDSDAATSTPTNILNLDTNGKPLTYSGAKPAPTSLPGDERKPRKSQD